MSENNEPNIIDKAVVFLKRQLTILQEIYLKYFKKLLNKYKVESPAELSEDDRATFFQEVEKAWKEERERRKNEIEEKPLKTKKELYYQVEATRPSVPIDIDDGESTLDTKAFRQEEVHEQKQDQEASSDGYHVAEETCEYLTSPGLDNDTGRENTTDSKDKEEELNSLADKKKTLRLKTQGKRPAGKKGITTISSTGSFKNLSNYEEVDEEVTVLESLVNPEQSDDLRIGYHPNSFFMQADNYTYPVVKMPKEGAYLKLPRKGRALGK